jgi:hypothetical protein
LVSRYSGGWQQTPDVFMSNNRRHFSRINLDRSIELTQGDKSWTAQLVDLSLKGLLIELPTDWDADVGQWLDATLTLDDNSSIHMTVNWRRSDKNQLGFEYEHIDIDSIIQLRRLVIDQLGDEKLLEREMAALGK